MVGESDVPDSWRKRIRRAVRPVWLWPTLLTLVVTTVGVGHAQPWRDELATWSAARRPLPDLVRLAATVDATLAPYYLFMHGWVALFGDSAWALRAPSVLAMTGAAGLTAVLGARLFGVRAGRLGGLLFAVLPSTARYGQEARPYAAATLAAVATTVLLVAALRRPGRGRWAGYATAVVALGLAHLVALTLLAAHALAVWGPTGRQPRPPTTSPGRDPARPPDRRESERGHPRSPPRRWVFALLPAVLVLTPLALVARGQRSRQLSWVDPARLGDLVGLPGSLTASAVVGGLLVGLAVLGAGGPDRDRRRWARVMLAAVAAPAGLLFVAGLVTTVWVPRYLAFTTPFLCLPAGAALASVRPVPTLAVVGLTAVLGAPAQVDLRRTHDWPRSSPVDYRAAARIVAAGQRPGDAVVYGSRDGFLFLDLGLAYHLGADRPRDVLAVRDPWQAGDLRAVECPHPARCLAGVDRVWLVLAGGRTDPVGALPPAKREALDDFTPVGRWTVPGITVALLTRTG